MEAKDPKLPGQLPVVKTHHIHILPCGQNASHSHVCACNNNNKHAPTPMLTAATVGTGGQMLHVCRALLQ
eukprot:2048261-Rhodomonas_salina.4